MLAGLSPINWTPFPGPQSRAYDSPADVLGYGGAAGGGKSDLLLGLAATQHRKSVILRREAVQGRGMIDRAREIFGALGRFNENTGVWRGLPGGRQVEFGGVKNPGDEQRHKGRPKDLLGIDEADMVPEAVFRFLSGWLRTAVPGQRCRVVMTFNPPSTAAGRWLLTYFGPWVDPKHPNPAAPGELRWYASVDGKDVERPDGSPFRKGAETITPLSRTFIPAKVQDNPAYMATGYVAQLQSLPEPLRSQLLDGDMAAGVEDDRWQLIPTRWVLDAIERWKRTPKPVRALDCLGQDVARGGRDQTVSARRYGPWIDRLRKVPGRDTPDGQHVFTILLQELADGPLALVNIDAEGIGSSAYDITQMQTVPMRNVIAVRAGTGTDWTDPRHPELGFANTRSAMMWNVRSLLDPAGDPATRLCLPDDPELVADLTAPRYRVTVQGIQVEPKDSPTGDGSWGIRQRLGRSTDCGDAVALACWMPPGPKPVVFSRSKR